MREVGNISDLALNLLVLAGGHKANRHNYYSVLLGGADDIFGMLITETQMNHWLDLGAAGKQVHRLLETHKNDQEKAYCCLCYDANTIAQIVQRLDMDSRFNLSSSCFVS